MQHTVVYARVRDGEEEGLGEGEFFSPAPTTNGCGSPSMTATRQNEKFLLGLIVVRFPAVDQVSVCPTLTREGVSHGSGRAPSAVSYLIEVRRRCSLGA